MTRPFLLTVTIVAGGTGLALLAASMYPRTAPEPEPSPYVKELTVAMESPVADKAFLQGRIDEYYAAPIAERATKDGIVSRSQKYSTEMATRRAEAKDDAQAAMVKFCEDRPRRCQ